MTAQRKQRVAFGTPGHLTRREYIFVFGVPAIALIALIIGLLYESRAPNRERQEADAAVEAFIANTVASSGMGALTRDPASASLCEAAERRSEGRAVKLEPYNKISSDVAEQFLAQLC